jgi:hypothetical protein
MIRIITAAAMSYAATVPIIGAMAATAYQTGLISLILGSRTIVGPVRQIGKNAYEVTLSDGSTWACLNNCEDLLNAAKDTP